MGQTELRQLTWSEPQRNRTEQHQNNDLLQQMPVSCAAVQSLGKQMQNVRSIGGQMQEGFATESRRSRNMEKTTTAKMEEGFRSEQLARQQAENEIKQMQKHLDVLKEEMRSLKNGNRTHSL